MTESGVRAAEAAAGHAGTAHTADVLFSVFGLDVTGAVVTMWAIMLLIFVFAFIATRRLELVPRSRLQALVELGVDGGIEFFAGVLEKERAKRFIPILGSFFILILVCNYSGLIPGAGMFPWFKPPTSHWGITGGLAAVVFFMTQYFGIRAKGLRYFKHLIEPIFLAPLMLILGIIEEFVRPFALSLRLFANIFGGETVLSGLIQSLPFLALFVVFLEVVFGFIQAFIFSMLTAVYFSFATGEEEH